MTDQERADYDLDKMRQEFHDRLHGPQRQPASVPQTQMKQWTTGSLLRENKSLRDENERLRKQRDVAVSIVHDFVALRRCMPTWLLDKTLLLLETMKGDNHGDSTASQATS